MTKTSNFYLSLGFLGISGPSLEKVTLPRQKVLNMGQSKILKMPKPEKA
jgi:hypothetical protein